MTEYDEHIKRFFLCIRVFANSIAGRDISRDNLGCPSQYFAEAGKHVLCNSPLRPVWKNILTIKTCRPAMPTIIKLSMIEKLKILCSVLLTVEKFLFSRVLKYFCWRVIVLSWPLSLRTEFSRAEVCSMLAPCLEGMLAARGSFSMEISKSIILSAKVLMLLSKQKRYSPTSLAVKTKSPWRSLVPSRMVFSFPGSELGPWTA